MTSFLEEKEYAGKTVDDVFHVSEGMLLGRVSVCWAEPPLAGA